MSDQTIAPIPWWDAEQDPLAWDTLYLGGALMPGVATVKGQGLKRNIDAKKAKGKDKATLTDEGEEPARLDVELLIYAKYDWEYLQQVMYLLRPAKIGGGRAPMSITHPLTALLGINSVYVDSFPVPEMDRTIQMLTVKFTLIEWVPQPAPVKKGGKGTGVQKGGKEYIDDFEQSKQTPAEELADYLAHLANQGGKDAVEALNNLLGDPSENASNGVAPTGSTQEDNSMHQSF